MLENNSDHLILIIIEKAEKEKSYVSWNYFNKFVSF